MFSSRNAPCPGALAAHQLRVAQDLHGTVGAETQRSMTWFSRLPFRVGMAMMMPWMLYFSHSGGNLFQRALDRHAVDGLVELGGVIVHRHHRVTVEVVGLADVDGPVAGLARAHDHHRAVGVLGWCCPRSRSPSGWFRKSRHARRLPPTSKKMKTEAITLAELKSTPWMRVRLTR